MGLLVRLINQGYRRPRGLPSWLLIHFAVLLLLLMTETPRINASFDYRTIDCKKGTHTMVLFPQDGPGKDCVNYDENGKLSQLEKDAILSKHNELRNSVASGRNSPFPKAADMMEMVWDKELETIAQRVADQCRYIGYECNHVQRFPVGQIIAERYFDPGNYLGNAISRLKSYVWTEPEESFAPPETVVAHWFKEISRSKNAAPPRSIQSPENANSFTQIAWGSSTHLGCAQSSYVVQNEIRKLFVCNYGPTGNELGKQLYKPGTPCSECSCSTQYPALCTP